MLTAMRTLSIRVRTSSAPLGTDAGLSEPGYLYNIAWVEFKALVVVTVLEDVPQMTFVAYVSNVTNSFDLIAKLQLATGIISTVYLFIQAVRNFRLHRAGYRLVKLETVDKSREMRAEAKRKLKKGHIRGGAKAGVAAAKEPKRSKNAQRDFDEKDSQIRGDLEVVVSSRT